MKLGIFGCGNMGSVLLEGILNTGLFHAEDLIIYDLDRKKAGRFRDQWRVLAAADEKYLVSRSDYVLFAVKPQDLEKLLKEIEREINTPGKIVISIAAGVRVSKFRQYVPDNPVVRAMPNTPMMIGKGACGIYFDGAIPEDRKKTVLSIFQASALTEVVPKEDMLDAVTGLSGSGPAYVFSFIKSLADGGVQEGLPRDVAEKLAIQTVLGSSEMAMKKVVEDGSNLEQLKDMVTSPGGTTAAGLYALERERFRYAVMKAVREASQKSRKLGGSSK